MFKNTAAKFMVFAWDTTTGVAKTGDAANITAYVSKDYGTVTVLADTSATEMDATNGKGYYLFDAAQGETNGDCLMISAKSSTANIAVVGAPAVIYTRPTTNWLAPATLNRTLVVDAAGLADANMVKAGPTGSGTAQTAKDIGGAVPAVAAGASGGLLISGSNSGTTTLAALTVTGATTLTGNMVLSDGITISAPSTLNRAGITITGNGTGQGIISTGGATGDGIKIVGGASGHGLTCQGTGTTKHGINAIGGTTTSAGIAATGGATSGDGILITATSGHGITSAGGGTTKHGMLLTGGATTSAGLFLQGGATSGDGLKVVTVSGHGINLAPVGTNMHGLFATGGNGGVSDGIKAAAGTGGVDFRANRTGNLTGTVDTVTAVTGLTASNLDTTISSRMATYTQPTGFLSATFPAGTVANTTNITAGTITTTTNLTNAPTAGDFTSTMKTSLNASTPASVTGAVGSVTGSVGSVVAAVGITSNRKKASTATFEFLMQDSVTGAPKTGLTVAATISKDGGVSASTANAVTEIGLGQYQIVLTGTEMNMNNGFLQFIASGAITYNLSIQTQP